MADTERSGEEAGVTSVGLSALRCGAVADAVAAAAAYDLRSEQARHVARQGQLLDLQLLHVHVVPGDEVEDADGDDREGCEDHVRRDGA